MENCLHEVQKMNESFSTPEDKWEIWIALGTEIVEKLRLFFSKATLKERTTTTTKEIRRNGIARKERKRITNVNPSKSFISNLQTSFNVVFQVQFTGDIQSH